LQERIFHGETMKQMHHIDFKYNRTEFGYDWLLMRRQALHEGLLDVAQQTPDGCVPIEIFLGREAVALDCEVGKLEFRNSEDVVSDLVVVADGVHSKLIDAITDNTTPPLQAGRTAYRFMVPRKAIMADPELRAVYENEEEGLSYYQIPERNIYFLVTQSDEGESFFCLLVHPALKTDMDAIGKWSVEGSRAELMKLTENFHPVVRKLCELAATPLLWTICCREPLKSCVKGKAVAIGDACHPHLPHHGQGAAAAAEDAAALGVFLTAHVTPSEVSTVLRQWESFRLPRAKAIQLITITFPTPIEALRSKVRTFYDGPLPENVDGHERTVTRWFYSYDVVAEAARYCNELKV
jgi:salicylate hydroxylase